MSNPYAPPQAIVADIEPVASDTILPADRGVRLGAALLDGVIFCVMVYIPMFAGFMIGGLIEGSEPEGAVTLGTGITLGVLGFAGWLVLTIKYLGENGQSIAKKMLGIKIVRSDGSMASLGRIILWRNIVNSVLGVVPLYGIVDVLFIFGDKRQCLHDKLADTVVIYA